LKLKEDDLEVYDGSARVSKESENLNGNRDEYLLSLNINNQHSQTYLDLALVYEAMDNINEAIIAMDKALTMEPNNPRYLDTMIEFSIIKKDKTRALATLKKFSEVNPENQKLPILREQVDKL
jgi:tetratricopeptide (TPR) repeat protein